MIIKTRIRPHMADVQRYKLHVVTTLKWPSPFSVATPAHRRSKLATWFRLALRKKRLPQGSLFVLVRPPGFLLIRAAFAVLLRSPPPSLKPVALGSSSNPNVQRIIKPRAMLGVFNSFVRPPGFEPRTLVPKTSVISISPWARCEEPILNAILRYRKPNDKAYDSR